MPNVSYTVSSFDGKFLDLQLTFVNPNDLYLLATKTKNKIVISINNTQLLLTKKKELAYNDNTSFTATLPIQISTIQAKFDSNTANSVADTSKIILTQSLIFNFLIAGGMSKIWGTINVLQLVLSVQLLNVNLPSNIAILYGALVEVTNFDYF